MSVTRFTPKVNFTILTKVPLDLNNASSIIIHYLIGSSVVLKFKRGVGAGYDGDVTIDPISLNRCWAVATPAQADRIAAGQFKAEIHIQIPYIGYLTERRIKAIASLKKITFPTTIK